MAFNHHHGDTLSLAGADIYYEVHGKADDPVLVFLHGGLGTMQDFNAMLPAFRRHFRMIAIDSRGQGKSTLGTAAVTYERMQLDAEAVLKHLGVGNYNVIGFSDGAITALRMAARAGSGIQKVVAIGVDMKLKPDDPVRKILSGVTAESWAKKFPETLQLYNAVNPAPNFGELIDAIVPMWLDDSPTGYPGDTVKNITCELLVVRGDDDHLVSREKTMELLQAVPKAKLLTIPFAGHEAHKDQTQLMMLSVNQFLED